MDENNCHGKKSCLNPPSPTKIRNYEHIVYSELIIINYYINNY